MTQWKKRLGRSAVAALMGAFSWAAHGEEKKPIELPGSAFFPESITTTSDGSLFVGSMASGGVTKIAPGGKSEIFIQPAAFGTRSILGVLADERSQTLWVCSNDASGLGIPGPSFVPGAYLKAFDLKTGKGKISAQFPGKATICNDIVVASDGTVYATNTAAPQILRLKPGAKQLDVWLENDLLIPKNGSGLDGIAFGEDGNLYVNTFGGSEFFRINVKDGAAGAVTKLATSRALSFPDALRPLGGNSFLMVEGAGTLDRVTINGDQATIATLKDGLNGPTSLGKIGDTVWVGEGQLGHLFDPKKNGPPKLPFQIVPVDIGR